MPATRLPAHLALLGCCLLAACDPGHPPVEPGTLPVLSHDYGTVPHSQAREHEFVIDLLGTIGPGWIAQGAQLDCSCARSKLSILDATGTVQPVDPGHPAPLLQEGEKLILTVQLDTAFKEAVDLERVTSQGSLVLQRADSMRADRKLWPIRLHFAIDAPVRLQPFAILDFERVPVSVPRELTTVLLSDMPEQPIEFGPASCADPRVHLNLRKRDDKTLLDTTFIATEQTGSFRSLVTIDTDLASGYQIKMPVVGKVVPDLEASPMAKLSLRTDLTRAQPQAAEASQYLQVTDHDKRRPSDFVVAGVVDAAGDDASESFAIRFEPLKGNERSQRMYVRYTGGQAGEFRGQIVLAKDPENGPFLTIQLVALHHPGPQ